LALLATAYRRKMLDMSSDTIEQPIEIEDEYQLGLDVGVDDESAEEATSASFSITSYGADYPVDTLVKRMKDQAFFIPKFQRNFVWSQRHASRFIESLLMGLPVPGIFLYKEAETGKHLVVDGQQRLRTLQYFYSGLFLDKAFRLIGVRKEWDGKSYEELETSEQLRLDDSILHATIFQQDQPKNTLRSLYFVFERINSGGIRLSPQEIRNCISQSIVLEAARALNENPDWRAIFGKKKNTRLKDQELVLRALAMMNGRQQYAAPMRDFLNTFASNEEEVVDGKTIAQLSGTFQRSIAAINKSIGQRAFRPSGTLNAAVFEAVMVGISERVRGNQTEPNAQKVIEAYEKLLADQDFKDATERATAREELVKTRQRLAIEAFANT
jgi:hypothetical protein